MKTVIPVTSTPSYEIEIAHHSRQSVGAWVQANRYQKVLLVTTSAVITWAKEIEKEIKQTGVQTETLLVADGESAKTVESLTTAWNYAAEIGLERTDLIIGIGGGALTDLAGFFAATWLRGIGVVHVPTTLLGMVDAAVGGKTGINIFAGKNLAGAFYPPKRVFIDPLILETLPEPEFKAGLAEIIKCGFIKDKQILRLCDGNKKLVWDSPVISELIERAVTVKAHIVSEDLRETGQREYLNYGHTLGHAIEKITNYRIRHGEAVAIGMVYAVKLANRLGYASESWVKLHLDLIHNLGLPSAWEAFDYSALFDAMLHDKKVRSGNLRFVFTTALERENSPGDTWVSEVPLRTVLDVLESN
ncbi:3-dehydroquinate synthase [Gleimia coleocanis DSM 15436]|uniref:3-dehydroquinate synthase n=1 Tax=Gleimia coleocanis DSM 15436 TaxID=525245 RepID=C0W1M1_9ACTO|nr:3-dehydroquinate synthase [Gleimia coleocanis]EEH63387.1 3-dehydroquinate synthase [Gleimia coleocanis DSM 15436]